MLVMAVWIPVGYLIEYSIDQVDYMIWYDIETDEARIITPIHRTIDVPDLVKQHWIESYDNHWHEADRKYIEVEQFGRSES